MILLALDWLHSKGIIFGNLSPKNILVGMCISNKILKISYFSLMNPDIKRKRTTTTTTESDRLFPAYCSPEVIEDKEDKPLTAKADMWALGILLYQALSSMKHPFEGES
jgi:serine/threonine protein kinase